MADAENGGSGGAAPEGTDGNGQAGDVAVGTEKDASTEGEGVVTVAVKKGKGKPAVDWDTVNALAHDTEGNEGQYGRRVVKVLCDDPTAPDLWYGAYGNAPVVPVGKGRGGFVLSDGSEVTL